MPESHTSVNLASKIKAVLNEFHLISKVEVCVHDNARNMECAGALCPEQSDLGCFGHRLQLCLKPALETQTLYPKITKKNDSILLLKDYEWEMLSDMSNVLKDFSEVTTYMCSEKYVSVSQIYSIICGLLGKRLVINEDDSSAVRRTKDSFREELYRRYKPSENETAKSVPVRRQ